MALSNLDKQAENIEGDIMDAFIDDAGTLQSLGILQDATVSFSPVTQDADVANRQKVIAVDVEVNLVMQQTTDNELSALKDVVSPTGKGHTLKLTKTPTAEGSAASANGYEFVNTFPRFEGEFDGSGEGSTFTVMFGGRVLPSELSDPSTIKFDA
ncbi:hypothetical protein [Salinibacter phage M31CR41-2]|uniref:Uncharacterized protein n=1 Tax=Salinibacter phage M31CR41-2 TaxID=2681614 RepID=A0A2I6UH53_9CAUD|nr:hypothetical protein FGG68_gp61 [Salinibacter phage M31CR41-2]AUO79295.1 hypothetical protein [Salinibacter phage M31CR41-2]AUO79365.1 hypothetical protein [Salinibacter virus M31CR41-3]